MLPCYGKDTPSMFEDNSTVHDGHLLHISSNDQKKFLRQLDNCEIWTGHTFGYETKKEQRQIST